MKAKKIITVVASALLVATTMVSASIGAAPKYDYNVKVNVNQKEIGTDVKPFIDRDKNRTYVPIRFISEALGEKVEWNNKTKTVTVKTAAGKKIELSRGQKSAKVNGIKQALDAPALEIKNRVMVPLRFVSEQMGAVVDVKKANAWTIVSISYAGAPGEKQGDKEPLKNNTFSKFELNPKYNKLAPHLFKDNMRVENGELIFKVPDLNQRSGAVYMEFGKPDVELIPGKEYRYKLNTSGYLDFYFAHTDENMEGYYVYLSPSNKNLKDEFKDVNGDAVVVNNLPTKRTASPLTDVVKAFE